MSSNAIHLKQRSLSERLGLRRSLAPLTLLTLLNTAACTSPVGNQPVSLTTPTPISSLQPSPAASPIATLLPMPAQCPIGGPQGRLPNLPPVVGTSPVWAVLPLQIHIATGDAFEPPYGWYWKIVWEIGPHYQQPVTVWGANLAGTRRLWFQFYDSEPHTQTLVLDPRHPDRPFSVVGEQWAEFGSVVFFPQADCYALEASWPGGHWRVVLAVGT